MEVSFRNFAIPNWFIHLATSAQTNFSSTNHRIAVIFNMQESLSSSVCKVKVLSQIKVKLQEYAFHTDVEFFKCFTRARSPICFIISPEKNKKLTSAFSWKHTTSQAWIRQNTQKRVFFALLLENFTRFQRYFTYSRLVTCLTYSRSAFSLNYLEQYLRKKYCFRKMQGLFEKSHC